MIYLTAERLREVLHYEPSTGVFTWRVKPNRRIVIGAVAGSKTAAGRIQISVDGTDYLAHRLAWLYQTGTWPTDEIDHWDTHPLNNRFANLRDATRQVNQENLRRARIDSHTGLLGVTAIGERFVARIKVNKKSIHLGRFDTAEAAHLAYVAAKRERHAGNTL